MRRDAGHAISVVVLIAKEWLSGLQIVPLSLPADEMRLPRKFLWQHGNEPYDFRAADAQLLQDLSDFDRHRPLKEDRSDTKKAIDAGVMDSNLRDPLR